MPTRTPTTSTSRSASAPSCLAAASPSAAETSADDSSATPGSASPRDGDGNHVSSTAPVGVTVASPTPYAPVGFAVLTGVNGNVRRVADTLHLAADPVELTAALVDTPSVSEDEARIADLVERSLKDQTALEVTRSGNAVLARTNLGRPSRVVLAGHLDTVPINDNLPSRLEHGILHGAGTVDARGGDAVMLPLPPTVADPRHDLTFIFYDCEEIEAVRNGLGRIERELPEWLHGDLAIVCEPSNGVIEAGCQGTIRVELRTKGVRAHTARGWMGVNAIHAIGDALSRLAAYEPRQVEIDGCLY